MEVSIFFNFAVVVFILWYFSHRPLLSHYRSRSEKTEQALRASEAQAHQASEDLSVWTNKLGAVATEITVLESDARTTLVRYRESTMSAAEQEAERVRRESAALGQTEVQRAKETLSRDVAVKSLRASRRYLTDKLEDKDRENFFAEFVERA